MSAPKTARNASILRTALRGASIREIAQAFKLNERRVREILARAPGQLLRAKPTPNRGQIDD